jgi:hypothetical protein
MKAQLLREGYDPQKIASLEATGEKKQLLLMKKAVARWMKSQTGIFFSFF